MIKAAKSAPINIRDVAQAAGVSVATVSRALRSPDVVSPDTLEKVQAVVRRLNYTANALPQMLRTQQTRLIIALVPDIANPFFSEVIRGIERVCQTSGYSVLLGETQYEPQGPARYIDMVSSKQADGIISMLPDSPPLRDVASFPFVNACEYIPDEGVSRVVVDNVGGAFAAVDYLVSLGHRQIAFVNGRPSSPLSADRLTGYRQALERRGLPFDADLIAGGDFTVESGITAIRGLNSAGKRFTAVFCANDEMALGAMTHLKTCAIRIPQDVSVIGFDDIRLARYFDPALTTIAQPMAAIGEEAAVLLIGKLNGTQVTPVKRVLPTQLVIRNSTAAVRQTA